MTLAAMTLVEVLVSLAILAITLSFALSVVGPWLGRGKILEREARFWRDAQTARFVVDEMTTGALNVDDNLRADDGQAEFLTYAPRLAPRPIMVDLTVRRRGTESLLTARWPGMAETVILAGEPALRIPPEPLRRGNGGRRALVIEAQVAGLWTPIVVSPFPATGPSTCAFDLISQACR